MIIVLLLSLFFLVNTLKQDDLLVQEPIKFLGNNSTIGFSTNSTNNLTLNTSLFNSINNITQSINGTSIPNTINANTSTLNVTQNQNGLNLKNTTTINNNTTINITNTNILTTNNTTINITNTNITTTNNTIINNNTTINITNTNITNSIDLNNLIKISICNNTRFSIFGMTINNYDNSTSNITQITNSKIDEYFKGFLKGAYFLLELDDFSLSIIDYTFLKYKISMIRQNHYTNKCDVFHDVLSNTGKTIQALYNSSISSNMLGFSPTVLLEMYNIFIHPYDIKFNYPKDLLVFGVDISKQFWGDSPTANSTQKDALNNISYFELGRKFGDISASIYYNRPSLFNITSILAANKNSTFKIDLNNKFKNLTRFEKKKLLGGYDIGSKRFKFSDKNLQKPYSISNDSSIIQNLNNSLSSMLMINTNNSLLNSTKITTNLTNLNSNQTNLISTSSNNLTNLTNPNKTIIDIQNSSNIINVDNLSKDTNTSKLILINITSTLNITDSKNITNGIDSTNSPNITNTNNTWNIINTGFIQNTTSTSNSTSFNSTEKSNSTNMLSTNYNLINSSNLDTINSTLKNIVSSSNLTTILNTISIQPQNQGPKISIFSSSFDYRLYYPKCIKSIRDQGKCGSCWAMSATDVMSSRLCQLTNGVMNINMSPQYLVSCDTIDKGCDGGSGWNAFEWMRDYGVANEDCMPYGETVKYCNKCRDGSDPTMYKIKLESIFNITDRDLDSIKNEIKTNGPVVAANVKIYNDFYHYVSGIYSSSINNYGENPLGYHAMVIVGWGEENGIKYWTVKNHFGTDWGENGYIRIKEGEIGIDSHITYATPLFKYVSTCPDSNCTTCDYTGYCFSCKQFTFPLENKCWNCPATCTNCLGNPLRCTTCLDKYGLSGSNCVACPANCVTCGGNPFGCITCKEGFGLLDSVCVSCPVNCKTCGGNPFRCLTCKEGFGISGSICVPCPGNCKTCGGNPFGCLSCQQGLELSNSVCLSCPVNCKSCGGNPFGCLTCQDGFTLLDSNCVSCPEKCNTCSGNPMKCLTCQEGFGLLDSNCVACSPNCKMCGGNPLKCLSCQEGFGLFYSKCIACPQTCKSCGGDPFGCFSCKDRFGLLGSKCVACPNACKTCEECSTCQDLIKCSNCDTNYNLINYRCSSPPPPPPPSGCFDPNTIIYKKSKNSNDSLSVPIEINKIKLMDEVLVDDDQYESVIAKIIEYKIPLTFYTFLTSETKLKITGNHFIYIIRNEKMMLIPARKVELNDSLMIFNSKKTLPIIDIKIENQNEAINIITKSGKVIVNNIRGSTQVEQDIGLLGNYIMHFFYMIHPELANFIANLYSNLYNLLNY